MKSPSLSSENVHATCIAIDGRAVLLAGRPGSGKSDLALRLIDRGARLVSDDYTLVRRVDGQLLASPPATIAGKIEIRHVGVVEMAHERDVPVALIAVLDRTPARLPMEQDSRMIAGVAVPAIALAGLEASAPIKLEAALKAFGLPV